MFLSADHLSKTIMAQIGGFPHFFGSFLASKSSGIIHQTTGFLIGAKDTWSD